MSNRRISPDNIGGLIGELYNMLHHAESASVTMSSENDALVATVGEGDKAVSWMIDIGIRRIATEAETFKNEAIEESPT